MHTRDAQGRQVSLLNDDPPQYQVNPYLPTTYPSGLSLSSSEAPVLMRSNSFDSQNSGDALSPTTPGVYDYGRAPTRYPSMTAASDDYGAVDSQNTSTSSLFKQPSLADSSRSTSYDEDSSANSLTERLSKRYPCRYRDTHRCDKTFTTSGHASRHSKIHTAEKAVPCAFPNCNKKFTRLDNMKQHLETHYKGRNRPGGPRSSESRSSAPSSSSSSSSGTSAISTSTRTGSSSNNHRHRSTRDAGIVADAAQYKRPPW